MAHREHSVAIVVDQGFGQAIVELAKQQHVWVCESPENHEWASRVWESSDGYSLEQGVTTFKFDPSASPEQVVVKILSVVDLHHGEYSHDPPWSVLQVIGARPTAELRAELGAYGVSKIDEQEHGFEARRQLGSA